MKPDTAETVNDLADWLNDWLVNDLLAEEEYIAEVISYSLRDTEQTLRRYAELLKNEDH